MHFTGSAIDGPFQLYNALRRIAGGFRPGVDFQFFHGLGIPYAHYWLFRLFGGGLKGSELARELFATSIYTAVYVAVFLAFTRSWTRAFALAAAALAASFLLHMAAMLFAVNGMLSLRSALPTLLPVALFLPQRRAFRLFVPGCVLGLALFMSTEQGLASVMAFTLVSLIRIAARRDQKARWLELGAALGTTLIVFAFALLVVGGIAGLLGAVRYNFRLVPMDQYWYFGAPPNVFISSWSAGFRMLVRTPSIGVPLALTACASIWYCAALTRISDESAARRRFAIAYLCVYGVISCASLLGVFTMAYAQPCWRVVLIVGLLEASRLANQSDIGRGRPRVLGLSSGEALVVVGLTAWAFFTIDLIPTALTVSLPHIIAAHMLGRLPFSASGIWPETLREGQAAVNRHKTLDGKPPVLWSTYAGWLEARNGIFNPSTDYIIHALGPENREAYVEAFRTSKPQLAQTVRPTYTDYERWVENTSWAFYDELLDWYTVETITPWSVIWTRRTTRADSAQSLASMNVPAGLDSVVFPQTIPSRDTLPGLIEVELEYETHNPLGKLPIIGATPRYLVGIHGAMNTLPISLDPFVKRERFPVVVAPGQVPTLRFATFSLLPGASWSPRTIRLYRRPIDSGTMPWMADLLATFKPVR